MAPLWCQTHQFSIFPYCLANPNMQLPSRFLPALPHSSQRKERDGKERSHSFLLVTTLDQEDPLEKEMVTPSSILAWKIPWTVEPGGLQSMESQRVRHNWTTVHTRKPHTSFTLIFHWPGPTGIAKSSFKEWRRQWQPTPVLLPGKFHGRGSLMGCHLWGRTESDMPEVI